MSLPAEIIAVHWRAEKIRHSPVAARSIWVRLLCSYAFSSSREGKIKNQDGGRSKRRGILLVDDHPLFRKGMIQLLGQEPDIEVRAEADSSLHRARRDPAAKI